MRRGDTCVLASFATRHLPKLISNQTNKIALFPTDDHELEWLNFEGEIEAGYGKGTVEIYDRGTFEVLNTTHNHVLLYFHGNKLKGPYAIVKVSKDFYLMVKPKPKREGSLCCTGLVV